MGDIAAYLEWTPAWPGDEDQGFSYGTFNRLDAAEDAAATLKDEGHAIQVFSRDPAWIARRKREVSDARTARFAAERAAAEEAANTPVIGAGATMHYPSDKNPYVVVAVSPTGAKVALVPLRTVDTTTGHEPAGNCNGFPVWDHTYTPEEISRFQTAARPVHAHRGKNGRYRAGGLRVTFGAAHHYRNHAD